MDLDRICRHCRRKPACRPRGLCWSCYYDETIRGQYQSQVAIGSGLGSGLATGSRPLPPFSTPARQGSTEKVACLAERAAAGVELWHPEDGPGPEQD